MGFLGLLASGVVLKSISSIEDAIVKDYTAPNSIDLVNMQIDNMGKGNFNENKGKVGESENPVEGGVKPKEKTEEKTKDTKLTATKSDKELLAEKNAKAAIMARNMSHNLGSHVLSYTQRDIEGYLDENKEVSSSYMRGLRHLLKYLQERQDFIATVATARVPYFLPLAFKETVFDFINPDYKAHRHPTLPMVDNILLNHIARSESYVHYTPGETIVGHQVLVSMYNRVERKIVRGDENQESLDFIREKNYMFPSGVVGRHAIMSIIENLIRNAAKHEKVDGDLEILMELCSHKDLIRNEEPIIVDSSIRNMYKQSVDGTKLDYLIFSYRAADPGKVFKTINTIQMDGLCEEYIDKYQNATGTNKGIKEIRVSASWLRGEIDEEKYKIWDNPHKKKENENNRVLAPLVYVQQYDLKTQNNTDTYIQFIIGLRKALSISIIKEGFGDGLVVTKLQELFGEDCVVYNTIEEYINDIFSNSAEYTIVAKEEIKNKIRMFSYERLLIIPEAIDLSSKNAFICQLSEAHIGNLSQGEIWIDDKKKKIRNSSSEIDYIRVKGKDSRIQMKYVYKKHLEQLSEWEDFIDALEEGKYPVLEFIESLTGSNSTDRLVRTHRDSLWFYRHMYAMKKKIAIIDERLYDMVSDQDLWQRALLLKLKGIYLFKIDEVSGIMYGFSSHDDYSNQQCVELGTIDITNDTKICLNDNISLPKFDYISIHQGMLDKLYGVDKNKERREVTDGIYECLSCHRKSPIGNGFQEGLSIHSGRSKPEVSNMPQKLPFIQYSALSDALFDCKYTLINLLSYAKYE